MSVRWRRRTLSTPAPPDTLRTVALPNESFRSPSIGARMTVLTPAEETGGEHVLVEFVYDPVSQGPPLHFHPDQTERYEVLEGKLGVRVDDDERVLGPGETAVVPAGAAHTFWNAGETPCRFTSHHEPAQTFERYITTLFDLDHDGLCGPSGVPRNPLRAAVVIRSMQAENLLAGPPPWLQRLGIGLMAPLGRLFGYEPTYVSAARRAATGVEAR